MKAQTILELTQMVNETFEFYGNNSLDSYMIDRGFDSMFDDDGWECLLRDGYWSFYDCEVDGTPNELVTVYVKFATEQDEVIANELLEDGGFPEDSEQINLIVTNIEF